MRTTVWGPVAREALIGPPAAIRWTALDPQAIELGLLRLDQASTPEEGVTIMNRAIEFLTRQIERAATKPPDRVPPLRNPWLE